MKILHPPRSPAPPPATKLPWGAGFSLVEALVAIMILGTLATLAAPAFTGFIADQKVGAAAADLHIALLKTRGEATKRNANVTLSPKSGGWHNGWQLLSPTDASVVDDRAAFTGLTITGPDSIVYQSSGRIQGTAPSFLITATAAATKQKCVSVDLSGRPYVKASSC